MTNPSVCPRCGSPNKNEGYMPCTYSFPPDPWHLTPPAPATSPGGEPAPQIHYETDGWADSQSGGNWPKLLEPCSCGEGQACSSPRCKGYPRKVTEEKEFEQWLGEDAQSDFADGAMQAWAEQEKRKRKLAEENADLRRQLQEARERIQELESR